MQWPTFLILLTSCGLVQLAFGFIIQKHTFQRQRFIGSILSRASADSLAPTIAHNSCDGYRRSSCSRHATRSIHFIGSRRAGVFRLHARAKKDTESDDSTPKPKRKAKAKAKSKAKAKGKTTAKKTASKAKAKPPKIEGVDDLIVTEDDDLPDLAELISAFGEEEEQMKMKKQPAGKKTDGEDDLLAADELEKVLQEFVDLEELLDLGEETGSSADKLPTLDMQNQFNEDAAAVVDLGTEGQTPVEGIDIGAEGIDPRSVSGEDDKDDIRGEKVDDDMSSSDDDSGDDEGADFFGNEVVSADYDDAEDIEQEEEIEDYDEEDDDEVEILDEEVEEEAPQRKQSKSVSSKSRAKSSPQNKIITTKLEPFAASEEDSSEGDVGDEETDGKDAGPDSDLNPPPLEEFKRLMDALGPDSMFEDDALFEDDDPIADAAAQNAKESDMDLPSEPATLSALRMKTAASFDFYEEDDEDLIVDKKSYYVKEDTGDAGTEPWTEPWAPPLYSGGKPIYLTPEYKKYYENLTEADLAYIRDQDEPPDYLVNVVTVVTSSSENSTALEYAEQLVDILINATGANPLINFQIISVADVERPKRVRSGDATTLETSSVTKPFKALKGMLHMFAVGRNTYQLIDGAAMKEAYGDIMPHIIMSQKNLDAVARKIKFALLEAEADAVYLSPRLSRVRFRGGAQEMKDAGYNVQSFEPLCVVDVES